MQNFPLQLKQTCIREVAFKAAQGSEFSAEINVSTNVTFGRGNEDPRQWQVTLTVHFKQGSADTKPLQYSGHIIVMGIFFLVGEIPEETVLKLVATNGPSMLYATARETIAFLTARGDHGTFLLPTVTFSDHSIKLPSKEKSIVERETRTRVRKITTT